MLYHILYSFKSSYSWLNVFKYQTFRSMLAFLLAFGLVLVFEPVFIAFLKQKGIKGQPIRDDGPQSHNGKQGTPTMGGFVPVCSVVFTTLMLADLTNIYIWLTLGVMVAYGALGFIDDWRKITNQDSRGLTEKQKLVTQFAAAGTAAVILLVIGFSTDLIIPYTKDVTIHLGWILFILFSMLVVVGTCNAVNLTDGLDGLAIGPIMTVAATYAVFAYLGGHSVISGYLGIHYVPGAGEITVLLMAIVASGLGFLWYNSFPAQVFMGDLGALALGGVLGFIAVIVKQELILVVAGGIFVVEALSVIIQRYYYKMTKKRIFKMAPVHHHFELLGIAEPKIIVRFWIISIVLALIALTSLKLR